MNKFWEDTSTMTIEEKQAYSIDFYKNIFRGTSYNSNLMIEEYFLFFKETLYPFTYTNNQTQITQLGNFLDSNSQFLLTPIIGIVKPNDLDDRIELGEFNISCLNSSLEFLRCLNTRNLRWE